MISSFPHIQDQCCWALGNLAGDGPECRDTLLAQGALQPMVNLLEVSDKVYPLRVASETIFIPVNH